MMCPTPCGKIHSFPRLGGLHHPYAVACVSVLNTLFIGHDSRTRKSPPVVLIPTSGSATLFSQHHDHGLENGDLHLWSAQFLPQALFGSCWVIGQFHWDEKLEMAGIAGRHRGSLSREPEDCEATI